MSEKEAKKIWSWREKVRNFLKPDSCLLDLTPDGERFLRSLSHPAALCAAVRQGKELPFPENSFDLILNDGGEYDLPEIHRVLKSGGFFLTQQFGGEHLSAFRRRFFPEQALAAPDFNLENQLPKFTELGFRIMYRNQAYPVYRFLDTKELWDYLSGQPGQAQVLTEPAREAIEKAVAADGFLELEEHRFIVIAKKR